MTNRAFEFYRGYYIFPRNTSTGRIKVRYNFKAINYHMPRSFEWTGDGVDELKEYIDALYDRRDLAIRPVEREGLAVEHSYDEPPEKVETVKISPEMLIAVILGELPLEMPIHNQLLFRTSDRGLVPSQLVAELVSEGLVGLYHQAVLDWVHNGRPISVRGQLELEQRRMGTDGHSPAANLELAEQQGRGEYTEVGPAHRPPPPVEAALTTREVAGDLEVVSLVTVPGQHSYFVRRVYRNDQLHALATSWHAEGPWVDQPLG